MRGQISVLDRIQQAEMCPVIDLADDEAALYHGAGWKLARFKNGVLQELFDPRRTPWSDDIEAMANVAVGLAMEWIKCSDGEVWLVMCSGQQLCEPSRIDLSDASALARMARVFAEQFISDFEA